jgi:hypothetical protein
MVTMPPVGEDVAFNDSVKWVVDSHDPTVAPVHAGPRRRRRIRPATATRWRRRRRK